MRHHDIINGRKVEWRVPLPTELLLEKKLGLRAWLNIGKGAVTKMEWKRSISLVDASFFVRNLSTTTDWIFQKAQLALVMWELGGSPTNIRKSINGWVLSWSNFDGPFNVWKMHENYKLFYNSSLHDNK